jgi:hypothetical protein
MLEAEEDTPSSPCRCPDESDDQGKMISESFSSRRFFLDEHVRHKNATRAAMMATPAMATSVIMMILPARSSAVPCEGRVTASEGFGKVMTDGDPMCTTPSMETAGVDTSIAEDETVAAVIREEEVIVVTKESVSIGVGVEVLDELVAFVDIVAEVVEANSVVTGTKDKVSTEMKMKLEGRDTEVDPSGGREIAFAVTTASSDVAGLVEAGGAGEGDAGSAIGACNALNVPSSTTAE